MKERKLKKNVEAENRERKLKKKVKERE